METKSANLTDYLPHRIYSAWPDHELSVQQQMASRYMI